MEDDDKFISPYIFLVNRVCFIPYPYIVVWLIWIYIQSWYIYPVMENIFRRYKMYLATHKSVSFLYPGPMMQQSYFIGINNDLMNLPT